MPSKPIPFADTLLNWNKHHNTRQMPWKGEKDPYLIWLSEIILQQTRVEQGLPYFEAFKTRYPTVGHLAAAPADEVMRLWQGLGYYSRARNLHHTAKHVQQELGGSFPNNFEGLKKLKGVGEYTAAAIASFAFGEPRAVVDGNVIRVLARVFGIGTPFDTTEGKKEFAHLAQKLIDVQQPGAYNQAIMDFGATVCTPQNPLCGECPLCKYCKALKNDRVEELPVRKNRVAVKERYFNYLFISNGKQLFIEKRTDKDIWNDLYQLPLIETPKPLIKGIHGAVQAHLPGLSFEIRGYSKPFTQQLTHRKIHARFIELELKDFEAFGQGGVPSPAPTQPPRPPSRTPKTAQRGKTETSPRTYQLVQVAELAKFAFPKIIRLYLNQKSLL